MKPAYWVVPELWPGATFAVIGGGPSLTQAQCEAVRGRCTVIAVNDAIRPERAPWADVHYFCDDKWWKWHQGKDWYRDFAGIRVTLENPDLVRAHPEIKSLCNVDRQGLCPEKTGLMTGQNSGYQAMNLAVHLGAKRILLLGFDMHGVVEAGRNKTHWFGDHPGGTSDTVYSVMLDNFPSLLGPLAERGIEVVNCTPGSALKCFPMMSVERALEAVEA